MLGRRKFMQAFGVAAVAAPGSIAGVSQGANSPPSNPSIPSWVRHRKALENLLSRREAESLFYERCRIVGSIDHDIASKRSFSLAAKVTFQRQRNVEREMEDAIAEPWYERARKIFGLPY